MRMTAAEIMNSSGRMTVAAAMPGITETVAIRIQIMEELPVEETVPAVMIMAAPVVIMWIPAPEEILPVEEIPAAEAIQAVTM